MSKITLTREQHQEILLDMDKDIEILSEIEIEILASKINEKIDIPFISENNEQKILVKIVKIFDRLLYKSLPNELYKLVQNTTEGISFQEAKELEVILGTRLNKQFNIPYLPEIVEQKIFELLISLIINAMRIENKI